jgi:hypothetical protein
MEYYKNLDLADIVYFDENGNQKTEQWKDVIGYEGLYQVSDLGRLKSLRKKVRARTGSFSYKRERILKQSFYKGYLRTCLTYGCKKETSSIHRLVALAFIPNPENKNSVNHKNTIKKDNFISNLEWNTQKENVNHAYDNNLVPFMQGERHGASKLTEKDVLEIRSLRGIISGVELSKRYNISTSVICAIFKKRIWKHI